MATRPYEQLATRARSSWSPQAREIASRLGQQLESEITAQEALGADLRAAREAAHLTQPRLAELAGIQQAEISRIECGRGNPTRDTLLRLTSALGLRLTLTPATQPGAQEPHPA